MIIWLKQFAVHRPRVCAASKVVELSGVSSLAVL